MTRLNPAFTSLKTLNITYQTPQQTLLGAPETLPTSEPSTPQIGYTVQESDLPVLSLPVYKKVYIAHVLGAGKFITGGSVYYRMKKNGASVASGNYSVTANYFYTLSAFFLDVKVGDLLELALWSSVSDSNWDYKAYQVQVSRIIPSNKPRLNAPCNFTSVSPQPTLTGVGSPSIALTNNFYPYHLDQALPSIGAPASYRFLYAGDTYGLYRIHYGDYSSGNSTQLGTSSSYRPRYYRNYVPTQIFLRGLRID